MEVNTGNIFTSIETSYSPPALPAVGEYEVSVSGNMIPYLPPLVLISDSTHTLLPLGLLWRFMPEVVTMWAVAITFLTSMYHMDKGDNRILFAGIMVLGLSGIITLMCNMSLIYIVIYTGKHFVFITSTMTTFSSLKYFKIENLRVPYETTRSY